MRTLVDLFEGMRALGGREALRYYNGYRTQKLTYRDLYRRVGGFVRYLDQRGLRKGDRLLLWAENRPEWAAVFWGCIARGIELVPVDFRSSEQLVAKLQSQVHAKLIIFGDDVDPQNLQTNTISLNQVGELPVTDGFEATSVGEDDVVEIVFTSGTTGDPKGVVHRHRNVCANLTPIQTEIDRFRFLARPFQPIRLLDLLPLSHMFGQSAGLLIPVLLGGSVVFTSEFHAAAVLETIRRERVSAVISVPRLLSNLRLEVDRKFDLRGGEPRRSGLAGVLERWWVYRDIHSHLGWKCWAFVVGGAQLNLELEDYWRKLGFVVIQGYGLTETSPVVAMNHPFSTRRGSIGKAIAGQQIKLAPDGEILVRGESVVRDYLGAGASETRVEEGWLHTGDIGEIDAAGRLYYKGRKKEMIVTGEGLNVYPQDVEAVLNHLPEVKDSVVVGKRDRGEERVHATLILAGPAAKAESAVRRANEQLESHQRIQSWSIWPEDDFPRTASTMKVKRGEVARRLGGPSPDGAELRRPAEPSEKRSVRETLAEMTGRSAGGITGEDRLSEDLALSSLERVEFLARLERELDIELDEEAFSRVSTVKQLEDWVAEEQEPVSRAPEHAAAAARARQQAQGREQLRVEDPGWLRQPVARAMVLPRWTRSLPVRWTRRLALDIAVLPALRQLVRLRAKGLENLDDLKPPVIFAANHASHFDAPVVLAALPLRWRKTVAPAMSQDYFRRYFEAAGIPWAEHMKLFGQYLLACGLFNAYPLPQRMAGTRRALKYTGELIDEGWSPLVFPEGERTPTGKMHPFKPGIGLMAIRLGAPVVPIHIRGTFEVYSEHDEWPQPGDVKVRFGKPVDLRHKSDYIAGTRQIEQAIQELASNG